MNALVDYYRCPERPGVLGTADRLPPQEGYFRFGGAVAYGRQAAGAPSLRPDGELADARGAVSSRDGRLLLPFDLAEVLANLRHERYPEARSAAEEISASSLSRAIYYFLRPALGVGVRRQAQRLAWRGWRRIAFPRWPVDTTVEELMKHAVALVLRAGCVREFPFIWFWPDGAPACAMMTHDVEGGRGAAFCEQLMDLDRSFGILSAFQVVPGAPWARNGDTRKLVGRLQRGGCEVNVHDLSHDGQLFRDRDLFIRHAAEINAHGRDFGSRGFRSGAMYRRQEWFAALDCSYDMSVPNVAHLEPQRGGCCTVMPFFIGKVLELPLTASQDYTVFHVLGDYSTDLWEKQIDLVLEQNGLASFIAHPDYLLEPRAREVYARLLSLLVTLREERRVWLALPSQIDEWWRARREMRLVPDGDSWRVEGPGSDRARVAYARLCGDQVVYKVEESRPAA